MNIFQRNPIIHIVAGALVLWGLIFLLVSHGCAEETPDAPSQTRSHATGRVFDRSFLVVHGVYALSGAFDYYVTARGVQHGCRYIEANHQLGQMPSNGTIAGYGAAEFAVVTLGDAAVKVLARRMHWGRRRAGIWGSVGAIGMTAAHVHYGVGWVRTGCL